MVGARLSIQFGIDRESFAELDLISGLEGVELPPDEGIIVGVHVCGNEGTSPVHIETEVLKIFLTLGREELEPVARVLELGDLLLRNAELLKNLILGHDTVCTLLGLSLLHFALESASGSMDGHACAVEGEGEEHSLTKLTLEADLEFAFREGVSVTYIILNKRQS